MSVLQPVRRSAAELCRAVTYGGAKRSLDLPASTGPTFLIGVYRRRNAQHVRELVDAALAGGWATAWWALDEVAAEVAEFTIGSGAGEKFPLLNEIIERSAVERGWIVVADDDVVVSRGNLVELVSICAIAGFALAQPAHAPASTFSHPITLSRPFSVARTTAFVEIGPLFVVAPTCQDRIVPFPSTRGMGWGLELEWHQLRECGCSLGIVDMVSVTHLGRVGASYQAKRLEGEVRRELASVGASDWTDLQKTTAVWRPWRRRPPWQARAPIQSGRP